MRLSSFLVGGKFIKISASALLATSLVLAGCGGDSAGDNPAPTPPPSALKPLPPLDTPRNFRLGLTPFSNGTSTDAKNATWGFVKKHSDLVALHFDTTDGLPWDVLATGNLPADLPAGFRKPFDEAVAALNDGVQRAVYVAINPLNAARNGMAKQFGGGSLPVGMEDFNSALVQQAMINYAKYIVETFNPAYLAFGIEANIYDINEKNGKLESGGGFQAFVNCYQAVYDELKKTYPKLPIFPTQQLEYILADPTLKTWTDEMALYNGKIDRLGLSLYPSSQRLEPSQITQAYITGLQAYTGLRIVVTETGYGTEPFAGSFSAPGSPELQRDYLKWLIEVADALPESARPDFLVWFFPNDAPAAATPEFPDAGFYLSMGLVDENLSLNARETQLIWDQQLTRPLQTLP